VLEVLLASAAVEAEDVVAHAVAFQPDEVMASTVELEISLLEVLTGSTAVEIVDVMGDAVTSQEGEATVSTGELASTLLDDVLVAFSASTVEVQAQVADSVVSAELEVRLAASTVELGVVSGIAVSIIKLDAIEIVAVPSSKVEVALTPSTIELFGESQLIVSLPYCLSRSFMLVALPSANAREATTIAIVLNCILLCGEEVLAFLVFSGTGPSEINSLRKNASLVRSDWKGMTEAEATMKKSDCALRKEREAERMRDVVAYRKLMRIHHIRAGNRGPLGEIAGWHSWEEHVWLRGLTRGLD